MKKLLLLLLSLGIMGSADAVSSRDDYFTSLCIAEKSTGFNWENNDWKIRTFVPEKYVIKKVDATKYRSSCPYTLEAPYFDFYHEESSTLETYGCYKEKDFGSEIESRFADECRETWITYPKDDSETPPKTKLLEGVYCGDIQFSPNGWFHKSHVYSSLRNVDVYKDSITVTVGKCSTL